MSLDDLTTNTTALTALSLTHTPTPSQRVDQATAALRSLLPCIPSRPHALMPPECQSLFDTLTSLLDRRQSIFTNHKAVLAGKGKEYAGIAVVEAQSLWREVERKLGCVIDACVREGMFDDEQVRRLTERTNPHFAWVEM